MSDGDPSQQGSQQQQQAPASSWAPAQDQNAGAIMGTYNDNVRGDIDLDGATRRDYDPHSIVSAAPVVPATSFAAPAPIVAAAPTIDTSARTQVTLDVSGPRGEKFGAKREATPSAPSPHDKPTREALARMERIESMRKMVAAALPKPESPARLPGLINGNQQALGTTGVHINLKAG